MITPGTPAKLKPATSNGQASPTSLQCRPTCIHTPGIDDPEVRVVGQDRLAGRGVLAVDHPGVAADPVAAAQPRRHPVEPVPHSPEAPPRRRARSAVHGGRRGVAGAGLGGVLLEDVVDHRALVDDRPVLVEGVRRVELLDRALADAVGGEHPVDLVLHVAAQVPRHRLEPGQRVDRRPGVGG